MILNCLPISSSAVDVFEGSSVVAFALSVSVRWSVISETITWYAMDKRAEAVVSSVVLFVPFARMANTGTHRGYRSHSLQVWHRRRPPTGMRRVFRRRLRFRRQPCAYSRHCGGRGAGTCRPSVRASRRRWRQCTGGLRGSLALVGDFDESGGIPNITSKENMGFQENLYLSVALRGV
jgi:hypothetical protein